MLTPPFPFPSCLPLPFFSLLPQKTQARLPGRGAPPPPPDDRDAQPGRNAVSAAAEAPRGDSVGPAHRSAGLVPGGAADALAHEPQLELRQLESFIVVVAASHLGRFDLGARLLPERAVVGQWLNLEARAGGQRGARGAAGRGQQRPEPRPEGRRRRRRRPSLDVCARSSRRLLPAPPRGLLRRAGERQRGSAPELAERWGGVRGAGEAGGGEG